MGSRRLVQAVRSLKGCVTAGENWANAAEARASERLDKISRLWALVKGLRLSVSGELARVAGLVNVELVCTLSIITPALPDSEGTLSGRYATFVTVSLSRPLLVHWVRLLVLSLISLRSCSLYDHFICFTLITVLYFSISVCC